MAKTVNVNINKNINPTPPDSLSNENISIECNDKIDIRPGGQTQLNLIITNRSSVGRMVHLCPQYDRSRGIIVQIPEPDVYVGPEGRTITYALMEITLNAYPGPCHITFQAS